MPTMNRAGSWVLAGSLAFAGSVAAQAPQAPLAEPKAAVPVTATVPGSGTQQVPRLPGSGSGRNQFFTPVMGIDIKAEGLALPAGVAQPEEPIVKPPAAAPPATPK